MRVSFKLGAIFALASVCASLAKAEVTVKALSDAEENRWIASVKNHPTRDGATVGQVLEYVEKLRPSEFKVGDIEIGYSSMSGEPEGVAIGYWIGAKRLDGDSYIDLNYEVRRESDKLVVTPVKNDYVNDTTTNAVEGGRSSFLLYIDNMYRDTCIDAGTHAKTC